MLCFLNIHSRAYKYFSHLHKSNSMILLMNILNWKYCNFGQKTVISRHYKFSDTLAFKNTGCINQLLKKKLILTLYLVLLFCCSEVSAWKLEALERVDKGPSPTWNRCSWATVDSWGICQNASVNKIVLTMLHVKMNWFCILKPVWYSFIIPKHNNSQPLVFKQSQSIQFYLPISSLILCSLWNLSGAVINMQDYESPGTSSIPGKGSQCTAHPAVHPPKMS